MKKLLIGLLLACSLVAANAATITKTIAANNVVGITNSVTTNSMFITDIAITAGTNTVSWSFYDAPGSQLEWTNTAYTSLATTNATVWDVFTNYSGVAVTNTNSAVYTYLVTNAATSRSYTKMTTIIVPASTTVTWTPTGGFIANFGILAEGISTVGGTNTAATIVVTGSSIK